MTNTIGQLLRKSLVFFVFYGSLSSLLAVQQAADSAIKEEILGKLASGASVESVNAAASADGQTVAWAEARGEKQWVVVVNGQASNVIYEEIGPIALSFDGKRLAYAARHQKEPWVMVVDGKEQDLRYDRSISSLLFSPDGQRLAYAGANSRTPYATNLSSGLVFDCEWHMVLDGKEGPRFVAVRLLEGSMMMQPGVFSPDSRRFAYLGWETDVTTTHNRPVIEDTLQTDYSETGSPVFSPDSQHIAYCVKRGRKDWVVLIDGNPGDKYEQIICDPAYSPDGKMALLVKDAKGIAEMIDNRLVRVTDTKSGISWAYNLSLSPGGERLAYVTGNTKWWGGPGKRARIRVVVDGQLGKEYKAEDISAPLFSADGRHIAYVVRNVDIKLNKAIFEGRSVVVLDGTEGKPRWQIFENTLRFTPENTITYVARQANDFLRITHKIPPADADKPSIAIPRSR